MIDETFCRLTVLAPRGSVDVALPSDVPLAELVPMVLELVGEPDPERVRRPEPWYLRGAAGGPLPPAATLAELGVLDGELLRLAPEGPAPAAPVFDDPVDALAATADRTPAGDHRAGSAAVLLTAAVAAGLLALDGTTLAALVAAAGAVAAVTGAARLVRSGPPAGGRRGPGNGIGAGGRSGEGSESGHGDVWAVARSVALAGVGLAAAAGWAGAAGWDGPERLLTAVAAAGVTAAVAQIALRVVAPALIAAGVGAIAVAGGALAVRFGAVPVGAAAAVGALALVAGPLLPRLAIRMAGLPRPVVPADGTEVVDADDGPDVLPAAELAERADLARGFLAGLAGGTAVTAAGAAVVTAGAGGWAGPAFAGVAVLVLGLRARGYADLAPARATAGAAVGAGLTLAVLAAGSGGPARPVAAAALLVVAVLGAAVLGSQARGRVAGMSPVARRAIDITEGVLVAASVPLAFWAMDLFRIVRGL